MQIRFFNESNLDKLDGLMKYLSSNNIEYTAHWIGLTKSQVEFRRKKTLAAGKEFDAAKLPVMEICWFG
jgi:hypothetical protein